MENAESITPIKIDYDVISVQDIVNMVITKVLNPNPIGQRGPTTSGFKKSSKIVESIIVGEGFGMISIRDIRNNPIAKAIYNCDFLVIDGGHRCRALRDFYQGKFPVFGKTFSMYDDLNLNDMKIPVAYYQCTSAQASHLFKSINTTTPTNFMEMVMSNEESSAAETIRRLVTSVFEYNNDDKIHPLFRFNVAQNTGKIKLDYFDGDLPNPRAKWYEWVAIAMIKAMGGRDAGQNEIENLIEGEPNITKIAMKRVNKFFDVCVELKNHRGRKFNADVFSAFMLFYFDLLSDGDFVIDDKFSFFSLFMGAYTAYTGNNDRKYEGVSIQFKNEKEFVKSFVL